MIRGTLALVAVVACDAGTGPPPPQASSVRALAAGQAERVVVLDSSASSLTWRVVRDRD